MFMFAGPVITPDQTEVVCDKIADGAKWTGGKIADGAKALFDYTVEEVKKDIDRKVAFAELTINCCTEGVPGGVKKTIKENDYARSVANDVTNSAIKNGDWEIFGCKPVQSILEWATNFAPKEYQEYARKLVPYAQTPEGQQALLFGSDAVFAFLGKDRNKLKNVSDEARFFFATDKGKEVAKELGQDFKEDVPAIASKIANLESVQNLVKEKWNELPEAQKTLMNSELAKLGVDIENLTPDKLTEENFAKIYDKVFPTIQAAFNKFVSAETNFDDISTLNAKDTNWVKAAYVATYMAKDGKTVDKSFEQLLHQKEKNGFEVFVQRFEKERKGKIIISYRDTNEKQDVISDVELAGNKRPEQLDPALKVYKKMIETYPNDEIIITGHSLGGSLAELVCSSPEARDHGKTRGFVFNSYGVKDNLKACGKDYQDNGNVIGAVCKSDYFVAKSANHVGKTYSVNSEKYADIPQKVMEEATRKYMDIAIADWSFKNANAQLGQLVKNEALKYKEAHQLAALADLMKIRNNELAKL